MYARVRDTNLYFDVEGAGLVHYKGTWREKPVIVALHGGPGGEHSAYKPVLSGLADKAQIIYLDHRGSGRSARGPRESYTLENNVEDLEALRLHLGLEKIALLGASYGGMVALSYAVRYGENLSHLVAVATTPSHRFLPRAQEILAERGTPEQRAAAEPLWTGTFGSEDQLREYFEILGPLYSRTYDLAEARKKRRILSPDALNEGFAGFLRAYDVSADLPRITVPTLVLGARHDWICAPEFSVEIARGIPGADLRIFEESGHSILSDEPEAFLDAVRGFLTYND
ncbi:alpha/beta fold hydrolase [Actinocorallia sp. A-T 12471]|uniref:alpha/beta fold hydrolase n=1 Tax=Actinocorallia sp. A-T 12471 TaxID=3089813 RepID=UPI0029D3F2F0|nr:alpha/beta fold hydrolase [Actinocorallia sp. A-T 12471]MDX6742226.1 alpha/beta fold hydrolase [Actinocorallia sp. A-T 12471]